ncbi:MAG: DEAD/DEAH box helicase [Ruminococcus sp.]|jgi:ATP-dependent Lhr-like helicase|nr:DEAD/DEAH box helicase [Ruminococcus sp.]
MDAYSRLSPILREYIYNSGWEKLRYIQEAACSVIFDTQSHLLLSSGTASGKTEAAFLPAITEILKDPPKSVGILYISPLKALINDQFGRIEKLLDNAHIKVVKWHGDASLTQKNKLVREPSGVMQTTPESIESLLINKREALIKLFSDLRFVIIDEVHYFMDSPRGLQLQCQLERIEKICNINPRRIGLSATISDTKGAEDFLRGGSNIDVVTPPDEEPPRKIRLFAEMFEMKELVTIKKEEFVDDNDYRRITEFLYKMTKNKKSIIFCNSRAETEVYCSRLKKYAEYNNLPDVYRIHHGSLSKTIREDAEKQMKNSEIPIVTCATVTLELGIDLGSLDRIIQMGSPFSVSSFVQRLGRSGRTPGKIPEMIFTLIDEKKTDEVSAFDNIDWRLLQVIAIIEIYTKDKWVEPIYPDKHNYSLLYHQTLSFLCSAGAVKASALAEAILKLPPFREISQEDFKMLLVHLLEIRHLSKDERGFLQLGIKAEPIVDNFRFYSVFETEEEFSVKCKGELIGTVNILFAPGTTFALGGRSWECISVDEKAKTIFVKLLEATARITWVGDMPLLIDGKVIMKMREILSVTDDYAFLSAKCKEKLAEMRMIAAQTGMCEKTAVKTGANSFAVFPWVSTRQLYTLMYALHSIDYGCKFAPQKSVYAECEFSGSEFELSKLLYTAAAEAEKIPYFNVTGSLTKDALRNFDDVFPKEAQVPGKFNDFVPKVLLRKQFLLDFCDTAGLKKDYETEIY